MKQQKSQKLSEEDLEPKTDHLPLDEDFTGLARSVACFNNQGFKNFKIVTLHIRNGRVIRQEYSDPYASFETLSKLEILDHYSILNLNDHWAPGKTLQK